MVLFLITFLKHVESFYSLLVAFPKLKFGHFFAKLENVQKRVSQKSIGKIKITFNIIETYLKTFDKRFLWSYF